MSQHDLIIVGGGITGLIHLREATAAGFDAVLLERAPALGGLWRELPSWQDIQITPQDWTVGDMPIGGTNQPAVLANIGQWASRFELMPRVRLSTPVTCARHREGGWQLQTPGEVFAARHLVCASGAHSRPLIPEVSSRDGSVVELHSSALHDPSLLRDQTVAVVGGGASAFDLLDLCFTHGAREVHWVHRGVRWFSPTRQPKAVAGSIRNLARLQAGGASVEQINQLIDADLRSRYAKFGLLEIMPSRPVDLRRDQLIPGRATMLSRLGDIHRHASTVESVSSGRVQLANADEIEANLLLWGTGYGLDLRWFEDARIAGLQTLSQMAERCAGLCRSLDVPNLYFPAVGLDAAGATSWVFVMIARTILSDIRGTAHWPAEPLGRKLNHLEIPRHLAEIDPASFPPGRGWEEIRQLALSLPDDQPYPMP